MNSNVIVPKLEYAQVWEENAKFVKQLEAVQMTAAKSALGCSNTTSNTVQEQNWECTHLKQIQT